MTSFHDCYVENSAEEISRILGEYEDIYDIGDGKTHYQWECNFNGKLFYIYDYKAYRDIDEDEVYPYHIGAVSREESIKIVDYLKDLGLNAYCKSLFLIGGM